MQKGGGKRKGSAFEREMCTSLSRWITHGKKDDCLWRSAISGGRATVAQRKGKIVRQAGDIAAVSPEGHLLTDHFFIECKHYRKLDIGDFICHDRGILAKFWQQAVKQARQHFRQPLLIAKENGRKPIIICVPRSLAKVCFPEMPKTTSPEIRLLSDVLKLKFIGAPK